MSQRISPTTRTFHVSADWPLNFGGVGQDGTVQVTLDVLDAGAFNRPTSVTVVFYPAASPANPTVASALAAGQHASADVPVQSPLQNGPTVVTVQVPNVTPGDYTLLIIGDYPA